MYPTSGQGIPRIMQSRLYCASAIDCDDVTTTLASESFIKTVEWEMLDKR